MRKYYVSHCSTYVIDGSFDSFLKLTIWRIVTEEFILFSTRVFLFSISSCQRFIRIKSETNIWLSIQIRNCQGFSTIVLLPMKSCWFVSPEECNEQSCFQSFVLMLVYSIKYDGQRYHKIAVPKDLGLNRLSNECFYMCTYMKIDQCHTLCRLQMYRRTWSTSGEFKRPDKLFMSLKRRTKRKKCVQLRLHSVSETAIGCLSVRNFVDVSKMYRSHSPIEQAQLSAHTTNFLVTILDVYFSKPTTETTPSWHFGIQKRDKTVCD